MVAGTNDETCCTCASADHNRRLALWLDREREPIGKMIVSLRINFAETKRGKASQVGDAVALVSSSQDTNVEGV